MSYSIKMTNDSLLRFTGMGAFIEVLSDSMYSGLVACWLYLNTGSNDELLRSITLGSWLGGHLAAWAFVGPHAY